jgi:tripartite-type tricarboxylate transporter receptor subunit TctC
MHDLKNPTSPRTGGAGARRATALACVLLASGVAVAPVAAQPQYPVKPLRIISPYSPGGIGDTLPRALAVGLADGLGQPVIVENRPGASQAIGMQAAARSAPDGYTLVLGSVTSLAINPAVARELPYDPVRDFSPVALCITTPL